jgi:hypothetical protein
MKSNGNNNSRTFHWPMIIDILSVLLFMLTGIFKNIFGSHVRLRIFVRDNFDIEAYNKNYFIVIIIFFTDVSDT